MIIYRENSNDGGVPVAYRFEDIPREPEGSTSFCLDDGQIEAYAGATEAIEPGDEQHLRGCSACKARYHLAKERRGSLAA